MKVLMVNKYNFIKGGSERYMFTVADGFKTLGHEVVYFSMKDDKNIHCEQEKYFINKRDMSGKFFEKIRLLSSLQYSKEAYKKLEKLIKDEKPDLAILNLIHKQLTLSIIDVLKKYNIPIFWVMHDLITVCPSYTMIDGKGNICEECLHGDFSNCVKKKCCHNSKFVSYLSCREAKYIKKKNWYNMVDLYICPSEFYKKKLEEAKFTDSKIVHIPNPLPIDMNYSTNKNFEPYFLYYGRISKEKGIENLIISMKNVDYQLKIVGNGPLLEELKELIITNNLENKIQFLGFKQGDELNELIKKARAVVIPSIWYENGPYSAIETLSFGKPLIVSNKGGLPELVHHGVNGYIFDNEEELIASLNRMISLDEKEYEDMCYQATREANKHNCREYIENLLKYYKSI